MKLDILRKYKLKSLGSSDQPFNIIVLAIDKDNIVYKTNEDDIRCEPVEKILKHHPRFLCKVGLNYKDYTLDSCGNILYRGDIIYEDCLWGSFFKIMLVKNDVLYCSYASRSALDARDEPNLGWSLLDISQQKLQKDKHYNKFKKYFFRRKEMNELIIEMFPKTKDAVLIQKWFGSKIDNDPLTRMLIKGKEDELLEEANRMEEEEAKNK